MNIAKLLFLIVSFFSVQLVKSQPLPVKWGQVSKEELNFTVCKIDTTASSVVLTDFGQVQFISNNIIITRHKRIKILDERDLKQAIVKIPFYHKNGFEKLNAFSAQTINLNGNNEVVKTKVRKRNVFIIKKDNEWSEINFAFADVRPGSIIEFKYSIVSKSFRFLEAWVFQSEIPTLHSEFRAYVPDGLDYRIILQGERLQTKYANESTSRWFLNDLPSFHKEPYSFNYLDFAEKIRFQLAGYFASNPVFYSQSKYVNTMTSWENLSEELIQDAGLQKYLNKEERAKKLLQEIINGEEDTLSKVKNIYNYVIENYKWNGEYAIFPKVALNDFLIAKTGNSAEINLLLVMLLKAAQIKAEPAIISTRSNGKVIMNYPLLNQFNHLVSYLEIGTKEMILDCINPLLPYFCTPYENLNQNCFVLKQTDSKWISISNVQTSKETINVFMDLSNPEISKFKLKILSDYYKGYEKRKLFIEEGRNRFISGITEDLGGALMVDSFNIYGTYNINQDIEVDMYLKSLNPSNNKNLYLNLPFFESVKEQPFKSQKRYFNIDYPFPFEQKHEIEIKIPSGYEVDNIPEESILKLSNQMGEFSYKVRINADIIKISTSFCIYSLSIHPGYYDSLKEFYSRVIAKYKEPLVLRRL